MFNESRWKFKKAVSKIFNKQPVYKITQNGIEVHFFDINNEQNLPFDKETYRETQLFIGDWSNPWYVDIESIKDSYPDFTEQEITNLTDIFSEKHIYPSQKYKQYMNQRVISDMYNSVHMPVDKLVRLMYICLAGIGIVAFLILGA